MPIIDDRFLLLVQNYMECETKGKPEMLDGLRFGLALAEYFVKNDKLSSDVLMRYLHNGMYENVSVSEHLGIMFEIIDVGPNEILFSCEALDLKQKYVPSFVNGVLQAYRLILDSRDTCRTLYKPGYTQTVMVEYVDVVRDVIEGLKKRLPVLVMA